MAYQVCNDHAALSSGLRLFRCYQQRTAQCVERRQVDRHIPRVLVRLGELRGLIYRSDRGAGKRHKTYVHFFDRPPVLLSDSRGRRLFILGGRYRVTRRGIEG